jgi:hypothetical protein
VDTDVGAHVDGAFAFGGPADHEDQLELVCRELLAQGLPGSTPNELDARHPYIPLAVDVEDDVAVVGLARRVPALPDGTAALLVLPMCRRGTQWRLLRGGIGGLLRDYPLRPRAARAELGWYLHRDGGGHSTPDPLRDLEADHVVIGHARLRASAETARVLFRGRLLNVPFHGNVLVVWPGEDEDTPPRATALDAAGNELATIDVMPPAQAMASAHH